MGPRGSGHDDTRQGSRAFRAEDSRSFAVGQQQKQAGREERGEGRSMDSSSNSSSNNNISNIGNRTMTTLKKVATQLDRQTIKTASGTTSTAAATATTSSTTRSNNTNNSNNLALRSLQAPTLAPSRTRTIPYHAPPSPIPPRLMNRIESSTPPLIPSGSRWGHKCAGAMGLRFPPLRPAADLGMAAFPPLSRWAVHAGSVRKGGGLGGGAGRRENRAGKIFE